MHTDKKIIVVGAGSLPEAISSWAPGVANRSWHFAGTALASGCDCLLVSIDESGAPAMDQLSLADLSGKIQSNDVPKILRVRPDDCLKGGRFKELVEAFNPNVFVGAGTLLAGASACALAGERPVWIDLFGDPMAEIQAKADVLGENFTQDEHIQVWSLMLRVLTRADRFSTVSHRQTDALLGQLALVGRLDRPPIQSMPCALEHFDLFSDASTPDLALLIENAGLPEDARIVLWSGGFNAWADPETLVRGVETAMDADPRLHLVATGGGLPGYLNRVHKQFIELAEASRHSERIHPLGWLALNEAHAWLRVADLALLVDRPCAETRLGARNRLLYYAAANLPTLASSGTEVVADMEAEGALMTFASGDVEAMARRIGLLLGDADRRRSLAECALAFCRTHYTFEATAGAFLDWIAQPERSQSKVGASEWIAYYLDVDQRNREWKELVQRRRPWWVRLLGSKD